MASGGDEQLLFSNGESELLDYAELPDFADPKPSGEGVQSSPLAELLVLREQKEQLERTVQRLERERRENLSPLLESRNKDGDQQGRWGLESRPRTYADRQRTRLHLAAARRERENASSRLAERDHVPTFPGDEAELELGRARKRREEESGAGDGHVTTPTWPAADATATPVRLRFDTPAEAESDSDSELFQPSREFRIPRLVQNSVLSGIPF